MQKKKEIWYKNFIVCMEGGEIVRFEATKGSNIYDAATDIVKFLKFRDMAGEYTFVFNDKSLTINRFLVAGEIAAEFFGKKELGL